ncbi:MAG TPA: hypothetical protein PLL77_14130 [Pyrinomonadaceae bacterium]|nr:hypothetical protein [Pyrinomonadaceae bacterium]
MTDPHPLLGQYAGKDVWRPVFNDPKKLFRPLVNISPTIRMVNNGSWTTINSFTHVLNNGKTPGGSAHGGQFILSTAQNTALGRSSAGSMSLTALEGFMYLRSQNEAEATAIKAMTIVGGNGYGTPNKTPMYGIRAIVRGGHGGTTVLQTAGEFTTGSAGGGLGTIDEARGVSIKVTGLPLADITVAKGLTLEGWESDNDGSYGTSYGIYADSSIDRGKDRYFIYSTSTSPSFYSGKQTFDTKNIRRGSTGDQKIDKPSFSVNFKAGATDLKVVNSFITENSYVLCTVQTNDLTATLKNATPGAGSVVIRLKEKATAETRVACLVVN